MNSDTIIHLEWEGPLSFAAAKERRGDSDWGVYQIYGCHPLYGSDVLLYIGKAERQYFGQRLSQEDWWQYGPDSKRMTIYLGRLAGPKTQLAPDDNTWCRWIDLAERLLIFAHHPAWNAQKNIGRLDAELQNIRVLNWGHYRSLHPEVSGARWTSRFDDPTWRVFESAEPRANYRSA
jgi:hypothetical protein